MSWSICRYSADFAKQPFDSTGWLDYDNQLLIYFVSSLEQNSKNRIKNHIQALLKKSITINKKI